jgi:hypothetical protein
MNQPTSLAVIAGIGPDAKPHGAQFDISHAKLVAKAAQLMGLQFAVADTDAALTVAKSLPRGRIYGSGRALAPIIKQQLYEQLIGSLAFEPASSANTEPQQGKDNVSPNPWDEIKVGSVVLYGGKYVDEGWWEAVVETISKNGDVITMRWRGAPKERAFKCRRHELGVLGREALKSLRRM